MVNSVPSQCHCSFESLWSRLDWTFVICPILCNTCFYTRKEIFFFEIYFSFFFFGLFCVCLRPPLDERRWLFWTILRIWRLICPTKVMFYSQGLDPLLGIFSPTFHSKELMAFFVIKRCFFSSRSFRLSLSESSVKWRLHVRVDIN